MALEATQTLLFEGKILWIREGKEPFELPLAPPDPEALELESAEARADYYKRYKALLWDYRDAITRQEQAMTMLAKLRRTSRALYWTTAAMTVVNIALFIHAVMRLE